MLSIFFSSNMKNKELNIQIFNYIYIYIYNELLLIFTITIVQILSDVRIYKIFLRRKRSTYYINA